MRGHHVDWPTRRERYLAEARERIDAQRVTDAAMTLREVRQSGIAPAPRVSKPRPSAPGSMRWEVERRADETREVIDTLVSLFGGGR
jgi:hypothetical protein